jgi:hypothetical protein
MDPCRMCGHLDTDFFDQSEQCDPVPLYGIWLLGFSFATDLAPIAERLCRRRPRRARLRLGLPAVDCRLSVRSRTSSSTLGSAGDSGLPDAASLSGFDT